MENNAIVDDDDDDDNDDANDEVDGGDDNEGRGTIDADLCRWSSSNKNDMARNSKHESITSNATLIFSRQGGISTRSVPSNVCVTTLSIAAKMGT